MTVNPAMLASGGKTDKSPTMPAFRDVTPAPKAVMAGAQ
jgi:hypothetical protein